MAGVSIMYGELTEIHTGFRWGHLKERDNSGYLDVDENVILKFTWQKENRS
jgi:hypothetical protein